MTTTRQQLANEVVALFRSSAGVERHLDGQVASALEHFWRRTMVSTDVTLDALTARFNSTRIPEAPVDVSAYFEDLADGVVAHSINTSSPTFIGHMTSSLPYYVRPLARLLTALNQNVVKIETSKALTPYEREALGMMHRLVFNRDDDFYGEHLQNKASTLGIVTSGGTLANTTALWIARNALGHGGACAVEAAGMPAALEAAGYRRAVVVASSLVHYSVEKAADLLGFGTSGLIRAPVDDRGRVRVENVRDLVRRHQEAGDLVVAIVGVAGTTDSGAIDPLEELSAVARETGAHFHVDAAWGGALLFSEAHRNLVKGIELADSVTIDGHKQLYLPMGIGMVLLRDPTKAAAIEKQAQYIIRADSGDLGRRALEGSRPGMAMFLHAALKVLGRRGLEYLVDEGIAKARYLAASVRAREEFELLVDPEMNIVNYRYVPRRFRDGADSAQRLATEEALASINEINTKLQEMQRARGQTFVSRTTLRFTRYGTSVPVVALRAVVANPLTTEGDIAGVLDEQAQIGRDIE